MCLEILSLCNSFIEIPKRYFDNTTYWDVLSMVTTKLSKETCAQDNDTDDIALSNIAASIFDHSKNSTCEQTVDYSLLDNNVISALSGDVLNTGDGDADIYKESAEVEIDVNNSIGNKSTKVEKHKYS